MANARYSGNKGNQRNSDGTYEGEQQPNLERAKIGKFGNRQDVNPMQGTGARTPNQAEYTVPKDNWKGK